VKRILVCGLCPLPWENTEKSYGPGIRTWQFAWSLARAGHEVRLEAMRIEDAYGSGKATEHEQRDGVDIHRHETARFLGGNVVARAIRDFRPDAVIGATIYGSYALARHNPKMPFWADQFGHVMAEAQAKAALDGNNRVLPYFWRMVSPTVGRADRISVVSERQRGALIGELGALGRLSYQTCGYDFTAVIPCALMPTQGQRDCKRATIPGLNDDSFVVLWSGSYNVWSDVETLFESLETAMSADSKIHFLSTGGAIPGHDEETYAALERRIAASRHRDRYHLRGWVAADEVQAHWNAADLGVLTEHLMYEGELGSKNRVIQWLGCGLPVAYNRVGDLGELLEKRGIGLVFDRGDSRQLTERIRWAADHRDELAAIAARAKKFVEDELTFERTTAELVSWAATPQHAPDRSFADAVKSPSDFAEPAPRREISRWLRRLLEVPAVRRGLKTLARHL
jgi:glycosyltransferase involved in cell wall biosynthesis